MKTSEILFITTLKSMYKARLCSSQEIPPFRSHFPCSELLHGAGKRAVAKSAQVSGEQGTCKQIEVLKEQGRSNGLRNPALSAAMWSRGCDLAMDSIISHTCSLSLWQLLLKSSCTKLQLDFLQC